jgi:hypothetical protein
LIQGVHHLLKGVHRGTMLPRHLYMGLDHGLWLQEATRLLIQDWKVGG